VLPSYPITGPLIGYYPATRVKQIVRSYAERISANGTILTPGVGHLAKISSEYGVYIIAGPIIERAGPKLYSTAVAISPEEVIVGKYRKANTTRDEAHAGISPGRSIETITIKDTNIGVFIEEDLAYPEVFRKMQWHGVNIIVGFMMPYSSPIFSIERYEGRTDVITMNREVVGEFLSVRSRETGVPIVLVGGVVNGSGESSRGYAFMPTITADPDVGVIRERVLGYEDADTHIAIEVNTQESKPRPLSESFYSYIKDFCKKK
jgi:predicted amidohydrolase